MLVYQWANLPLDLTLWRWKRPLDNTCSNHALDSWLPHAPAPTAKVTQNTEAASWVAWQTVNRSQDFAHVLRIYIYISCTWLGDGFAMQGDFLFQWVDGKKTWFACRKMALPMRWPVLKAGHCQTFRIFFPSQHLKRLYCKTDMTCHHFRLICSPILLIDVSSLLVLDIMMLTSWRLAKHMSHPPKVRQGQWQQAFGKLFQAGYWRKCAILSFTVICHLQYVSIHIRSFDSQSCLLILLYLVVSCYLVILSLAMVLEGWPKWHVFLASFAFPKYFCNDFFS